MFLTQLLTITAKHSLTFQLEQADANLIFTVIPQHTIPAKVSNELAPIHAALATPLRITVPCDETAGQAVLSELSGYIEQRKQATSNLTIITKELAQSVKNAKQSVKEKQKNGTSAKKTASKKTPAQTNDSSKTDAQKPVASQSTSGEFTL